MYVVMQSRGHTTNFLPFLPTVTKIKRQKNNELITHFSYYWSQSNIFSSHIPFYIQQLVYFVEYLKMDLHQQAVLVNCFHDDFAFD